MHRWWRSIKRYYHDIMYSGRRFDRRAETGFIPFHELKDPVLVPQRLVVALLSSISVVVMIYLSLTALYFWYVNDLIQSDSFVATHSSTHVASDSLILALGSSLSAFLVPLSPLFFPFLLFFQDILHYAYFPSRDLPLSTQHCSRFPCVYDNHVSTFIPIGFLSYE